jgi:hypothetical protein
MDLNGDALVGCVELAALTANGLTPPAQVGPGGCVINRKVSSTSGP